MLDSFLSFMLIFNKMYIHVPIIVFGLMSARRYDFFNVWICYLLAVFLTSLLKIAFKIPLIYPHSSDIYGFPSGHMMVSVAVYGYLFLCFSSLILRFILGFILICLFIATVHAGYHTPFDNFGAWLFAGLLVLIVYYATRDNNPLTIKAWKPSVVVFMFGLISYFILSDLNYLRSGVVQSLGIAIGLLIGSAICTDWLKVGQHSLFKVFCMGLEGSIIFMGSFIMIYDVGLMEAIKPYFNNDFRVIELLIGALPSLILVLYIALNRSLLMFLINWKVFHVVGRGTKRDNSPFKYWD
ncbi:MAG: hypothetical protein CMM87_00765 [Rickettsiales bacterium]|nr:hypothetical protein [Rickettsiales bacterium]|tara:strand:+ start:35677 stop:36564 length:888 start_codon:yes stop_codon:yes gene_type:complete